MHSISFKANMGIVVTVYGALYLNDSMMITHFWTGALLLTLFGEGGVTTFTNFPFI